MRRWLCGTSSATLVAWAAVFLCGCDRTAHKPVVLFDEGHGQQFLVEQAGPLDLSKLSKMFEEEGFSVKVSKQRITEESLAKADVLIISGPFSEITPPEVEAAVRFIDRGGRMCVMLHIASPAARLLRRLGVLISNGVIHEQQDVIGDRSTNFRVTRLKRHDLTAGLKHFSIFGTWALLSATVNAEIIAQTGPAAWADLNSNGALDDGEAVQPFGVVIVGRSGHGQFAVFGDDAIFQNRFLEEENSRLTRNLVGWLVP